MAQAPEALGLQGLGFRASGFEAFDFGSRGLGLRLLRTFTKMLVWGVRRFFHTCQMSKDGPPKVQATLNP